MKGKNLLSSYRKRILSEFEESEILDVPTDRKSVSICNFTLLQLGKELVYSEISSVAFLEGI